MKNSNISAFIGFVCITIIFAFPQYSSAYFSIGQQGEAITTHTALYTVSYEFGLVEHDIYMPIFAQRGIGTSSAEKKVGYSIHDENNTEVATGTTAAIVLADLPVVHGMYKIAKGAAQKMTLVVLYSTPAQYVGGTFSMHVDKMPYYVDEGNGKQYTFQLNPSELQYYVTPNVTMPVNKK